MTGAYKNYSTGWLGCMFESEIQVIFISFIRQRIIHLINSYRHLLYIHPFATLSRISHRILLYQLVFAGSRVQL